MFQFIMWVIGIVIMFCGYLSVSMLRLALRDTPAKMTLQRLPLFFFILLHFLRSIVFVIIIKNERLFGNIGNVKNIYTYLKMKIHWGGIS